MSLKSIGRIIALFMLMFAGQALADPNCSGVADSSNILDFNFKQACFKHDVCYSEGVLGGLTKQDCDNRFYHDMMSSCRDRRATCKITANIYYGAVSSSYFNDSFKAASNKALKIKKLAADNGDSDLFALLKRRFKAQKEWRKGFKECSQFGLKRKFESCMERVNKIQVEDLPFAYRMGGCNILGINWKNGHRAKNAKRMDRLTGVDFKEIMAGKKGDPCKGLYPSDNY